MPIVEIFVIVKVGEAIGAGPTILLLIADGVLGAWLIRHEGRRAWLALMQTLGAGRIPTKELADGEIYINLHTAAHKGGEVRGQMGSMM